MAQAGVISNPAGINGLEASYSGVTAEYVAAGTISEGQLVSLNTSGQALKAATGVAITLVVGVATHDAIAGEIVQVLHVGQYVTLKCDNSTIVAGSPITRSDATAGSAELAVAGSSAVGVALTANGGAAGTIRAFICPSNFIVAA